MCLSPPLSQLPVSFLLCRVNPQIHRGIRKIDRFGSNLLEILSFSTPNCIVAVVSGARRPGSNRRRASPLTRNRHANKSKQQQGLHRSSLMKPLSSPKSEEESNCTIASFECILGLAWVLGMGSCLLSADERRGSNGSTSPSSSVRRVKRGQKRRGTRGSCGGCEGGAEEERGGTAGEARREGAAKERGDERGERLTGKRRKN